METLNFDLLLRILVAHFLADFIFQPTLWVQKKNEHGIMSGFFWLHIVIHLVTLSMLLWDWNLWPIVLLVTFSHLILDALKSRLTDTLKIKLSNGEKIKMSDADKNNLLDADANKISSLDKWIFLIDQLSHLIIIVLVWLFYSQQFLMFYKAISIVIKNQKSWLIFLAYLLLSVPSSVLIGKITKKWSNELKGSAEAEGSKNDIGLEDAGKWIGMLERFLIFTFIAIQQIGAIGFLLAAKSVFRFGDINNQSGHKKTEYIIIGTLLSFSIAIVIGLIYKIIIQ